MTRHVAVLMGGLSAEREVSLTSGRECAAALEEVGHRVSRVDVGRSLAAELARLQPDVCFNALHGRYGEDGCVQGLLNLMQIPYTHSGLLASALAMDKPMAKRLFAGAGIRCAAGAVVTRDQLLHGEGPPPPFVVKPPREGSSVGVHLVQPGDSLRSLADKLWPTGDSHGDEMLVETFIPGRELTVAVLHAEPEPRALAVTDIRPHHEFFTYESKYTDEGAVHILPAELPDEVTGLALTWARKAHKILGCRGATRTDFRWDSRLPGTDGLFILELNTQPGMTPLSLVPEQARFIGLSFPELVNLMVEQAQCDP